MPGNDITVLLVDDNEDLVRSQAWLLESYGAEVLTATNGRQCLELVEHHQPDIILLDIAMPGFNGIDLCRRLKSHPNCRQSKIVAQTGRIDERLKVDSKAAGFAGYFQKPLDWMTLTAFLNAVEQNDRFAFPEAYTAF